MKLIHAVSELGNQIFLLEILLWQPVGRTRQQFEYNSRMTVPGFQPVILANMKQFTFTINKYLVFIFF